MASASILADVMGAGGFFYTTQVGIYTICIPCLYTLWSLD